MTKFIAVTYGKPLLSIVASAALRCSRRKAACWSAVKRMSGRVFISSASSWTAGLRPACRRDAGAPQHCTDLAEDAAAAEFAYQSEQRLAARPESRRHQHLEFPPHVVPIHRVAGVAFGDRNMRLPMAAIGE